MQAEGVPNACLRLRRDARSRAQCRQAATFAPAHGTPRAIFIASFFALAEISGIRALFVLTRPGR
jgi:hypothetical protein